MSQPVVNHFLRRDVRFTEHLVLEEDAIRSLGLVLPVFGLSHELLQGGVAGQGYQLFLQPYFEIEMEDCR